jgi:glycosyltransferase involved in cell wall biosynthesis
MTGQPSSRRKGSTDVTRIQGRPGGNAGTVGAEAAAGLAGPAGRGPTVVFIAGAGRSGSTLLERALGAIPGFVNVGELIDIFRRDAPRKERCGCGEAFATCPYWTGVGKRAFDHWDSEQLADVQRLKGAVARQRHLPRLLVMPLTSRGFRADVAAYGASYATLYQAIATEADAVCVVDASKWPVQALALARAGIDIRVVHLIRDVRGVAHSLGKRGVARPHALDEKDVMWTKRPVAAAVRWATYQSQVEMLPFCGVPVTRVRYEDFVCEPRHTVERALADLGLPCRPSQLEHLGDGQVTLGPSHGIAGNPSRFRYGDIALHVDEAWRDQMSRKDRILVTAIGAPLMVRYRRNRRRRTAAGSKAAGPDKPAPEHAWPPVSVIMPTRGRPELVRESIAAVVGQTYPGEIDCIVVHDQEQPDQGLASLGTARHHVRVVANTHAPGLPGARNTGLDLASGEFVATCDDDDLWHPDKLQAQITRLLDEPELLLVGSGMRLLLPGNKTVDWHGRTERVSYELLLRNRVKELHSSTLVMRRDAVARIGRYDEQLPHGYAEDYDWVLRAARTGPIGIVTRPLADVRRDSGSWYQDGAENKAAALEYMLAKHGDLTRSPRGHARILGQIAFARSSLGERGPALRYAVRGVVRWPMSPHPYVALAHITTGIHPRHVLRTARLFRRDMA